MIDKTQNERLLRLESELGEELQSMFQNISLLTEGQVERVLYNDYNYRLLQLQRRFDSASELLGSISLTQENPDLYALLEAKDRLTANYGALKGLQRKLSRLFAPQAEITEERAREERPVEQSEEVPELESIEEETVDTNFEALLAAMEAEAEKQEKLKKAAKQKAERDRQKAFTQAGREAEERAQEVRKISERFFPIDSPMGEKSGTDVYLSRAREEEQRIRTETMADQRKEENQRTLHEFHERMEASNRFYLDQKGHFDFSGSGTQPYTRVEEQKYGQQPSVSVETFSSQRSAERYEPTVSHTEKEKPSSERFYEPERPAYSSQESPAQSYQQSETRKSVEEYTAEDSRQTSSEPVQADVPTVPVGRDNNTVPSSGVSPQESHVQTPVFYRYEPGGTAGYPLGEQKEAFSPQSSEERRGHSYSQIVQSPAPDIQMRVQLERARQDYFEKMGTPQVASATHVFLQERQKYMEYQESARLGEQKYEPAKHHSSITPKIASTSNALYAVGDQPAHFQYRPWGIEGHSVDDGKYSGSQYHFYKENPNQPASVQSVAPTQTHHSEHKLYSYPKDSHSEEPHRPVKRVVRDLPKTLNREQTVTVSGTAGHFTHQPVRNHQSKPTPASQPAQHREVPKDNSPKLPKTLNRGQTAAVSGAVGHVIHGPAQQPETKPSPKVQPTQNRADSNQTGPKIPLALNRGVVSANSPGVGGMKYRYRMGGTGNSFDNLGKNPATQIHFDKGGRYRVVQPLPHSITGGGSSQNSGTSGGKKTTPLPLGTTFQPKNQNPNQAKKEENKEIAANLLGKSNRFNSRAVVSRYAGRIGSRLESYTPYAVSRLSRKMYTMMQSGEDNALRTFETGRYYMTTGVAVSYAVTHAHVVNSVLFEKKGTRKLNRQYYDLKDFTKKDLNTKIHENLKVNRSSKAEIKALMAKGSDLTADERKELLSKMREHASSSMEARKYYGYRNLQRETKMKVDFAQRLEEKKKVLVTAGQIEREMKAHRTASEKRIQKKFGKLSRVEDKDLSKAIGLMKRQGKDLKAQIKALKSKGVLTAAEQKQLSRLLADHKKLSKQLSKTIGLKQAREQLRAELGVLGSLRGKIVRNNARIYGGLIALQGFLLKPLQEGSEIGAQGLSKFAAVASNRNVHRLIKTTWKHSLKASNFVADKTGLKKISKKATKAIVKSKPVTAVRTATKQTIKTSVNMSKQAVIHLTPNKVKTAVNRGNSAVRLVRNRFNHAKSVVQGVLNKGKQAFAKTWMGRTFSRVSSATSRLASALRAVFAFLKGLAIKVGLGVLAVFLIVNLITSGTISSIIGAVSSMIMSPYSDEEGFLDLGPYVSIIREEQAEFEEEINFLKEQDDYDNVYINYLTGTMDNTKEMLSMMAVRLNQDLDIESNSAVKEYLESLFWDSHVYTTTEREYKCSGCKTRIETKTRVNPETGEEETYTVEKEYCPGHIDLTIEISVLGFDEIFSADTMGNADVLPGNVSAGDLIGRFKITYYCTEKYPHICNAGPPYKTATGTTPTAGRTIAVDPSIIPLGSHVIIDGHEYIAEDTGGAIDDYRIDICVDKHQTALSKGTRSSVPVYSVSINAPTEGTNTEAEGWNGWIEENIEWCKTIYQQNWADLYTGITDYGGIIEGEGGELIISGDFTWPVTTTTMVSSGYGWRTLNGERDFHKGIDIAVPVGTPIHAAADGTVTVSKYSSSGGYMISINHGNGIVTRYLHNSQLYAKVGDKVSAGDVIALSGNTGQSTGPHLHFDISVNGSYVNPSNYFDF